MPLGCSACGMLATWRIPSTRPLCSSLAERLRCLPLLRCASQPKAVFPSTSFAEVEIAGRSQPLLLHALTVCRAFSGGQLRIRSKTSRHSSEWIRRQINDRYVQRALECQYRSRAAFKLEQLDDAFLFLRRNRIVVDLGAYPGGWSQVAARRLQLSSQSSRKPPADNTDEGLTTKAAFVSKSRVIAIDKMQLEEIEGVEFIQGCVGEAATLHALLEALGDAKADVVLSDIAPSCTGDKRTDHLNSAELCLFAADLMEQVLRLGGTFVTKIFTGCETTNFKTYLRSRFDKVHSAKPKACRPESREMYFVAVGFKGRDKIAQEVQVKGSFSAREGFV